LITIIEKVRLCRLFVALLVLAVIVVFSGGTALAQQANPSRALPAEVQGGQTFNVTVTFTAPADKFNAISLTDFCPDGWNVTVDKTWCSPNADAVTATGNKAEIAWFGEPGVGFDNGTLFNVLYKVTVPDYAPLGIYIFNGGFLQYYLGPEGPYHENITGDSEVDVIGATLEGHVGLSGFPATNVTVRFFDNGTQNETTKKYSSTDSNGNFTIGHIPPGTYDVAVKGWTSLSNLESVVTLRAGNTTVVDFGVLLEGDARSSNDDYIDFSDYGPLCSAWLSYPGCPGGNWDPGVDFSRDKYIDMSDYGPLSANWLKWGDTFGWPGNWY
jgi:hypothetical protein